MESSLLKVYAVILNYNSADDSIALFKNLKEKQPDYLTVLVIDNNSIEADQLKLKENIPVGNLIFNNTNLGYAGGNNVGIEVALKSNANYVWILNPDVRVEKDSLALLVETMRNDKSLAAVGPRIIQRENPDRIFSDGEKMIMDEKVTTYHKNHNQQVAALPKGIDYDVDYIAGSSILLNVKAIKEIGKLPEDYFLYFEETDWCFKAKQLNWDLAINTNSEVYNLTSLKTSVFNYYFMRNRLIFSRKYHPDYKKVRKYYIKEIISEIMARFKGKYFKPYFNNRAHGLVLGLLKTSFK